MLILLFHNLNNVSFTQSYLSLLALSIGSNSSEFAGVLGELLTLDVE